MESPKIDNVLMTYIPLYHRYASYPSFIEETRGPALALRGLFLISKGHRTIQPLQISISNILHCKSQCSWMWQPPTFFDSVSNAPLQRVNVQYFVGEELNIQYPNIPRDDLIWSRCTGTLATGTRERGISGTRNNGQTLHNRNTLQSRATLALRVPINWWLNPLRLCHPSPWSPQPQLHTSRKWSLLELGRLNHDW